jgi:hypothetical protein
LSARISFESDTSTFRTTVWLSEVVVSWLRYLPVRRKDLDHCLSNAALKEVQENRYLF